MTILIQGQFQDGKSINPWTGLKFKCPQCSTVARIEDNDNPNQTGDKRFLKCPNKSCDELIYFQLYKPVGIVDYRNNNIQVVEEKP